MMSDIPLAGEVFRGDDGTVSTILPSNYGQDYEASEGELEEYAEYIGIDPAKEPELMWIAKEGLRAALPDGWRACQTEDNEVYYFNFQTGESLWDHPMDEHYKSQVLSERAKRERGGGGGSVGSSMGGSPGTGRTTAATGSTKAIADSFFLKPPAAATGSSNRSEGSLADIGGGVVVAATTGSAPAKDIRTPGSTANDVIGAPRAPPDVSEILALSLATSRPHSIGAGRNTASAGLSRIKEWEAALRKRLEERNGEQLRALRIELDKKADAERQRLAEARVKLQKDLDAAWERERSGAVGGTATESAVASTATQRRLQLAREVKQIEESWKARLHDVGVRVRELQQQVEAKQQTLAKASQQSPEELRKALEARNAAEVAHLLAAKKGESDAALARVKSEQASVLTEARLRANAAVAAAEKAAEAEFEEKVQRYRAQGKAMLAAMQAAVEAKQADLAAKEKAAAAAPPPTTMDTTVLATDAGAPSDADEAVLAAAQAAADAEVAKAGEASTAVVARLREEYAAKKSEREAALKAAQQQQHPPSRSLLASSAISSPTIGILCPAGVVSGRGISTADEERLVEEDQKLKDEADRAARIFEEETRIMVENKKAGRPLTAAPSADVAASVSAEALAALGRTANQEQRARDAENTRHFMAMKQLETKHDQVVRAMKAELDKKLASLASSSAPSAFNPRQQPSFTELLTARKRAWLRDHPAPLVEMPTLPPVPTLPTATLPSDVTAGNPPDEEEQARLIKARLAKVREEAQWRYDKEAQALRKTREADLEKWKDAYRSSRLGEVERTLAALKEAAAAESDKTAIELRSLIDAAAAAEATAGEGRRLEKVQSGLQTLEAAIAAADGEHERQVRALEDSIAGLEAALAKLRTQERHEEEAKSHQLRLQQQQQHLLGNGADKHPPSAHAAVSASPSRAATPGSSALCIPEEKAASEEAALRARWTGLIKALRAAVQREMEAYERALDSSSAPQHSSSAAGAAGTHPAGSLAAIAAARGGAPVHTVSTPRNRGSATYTPSSLPPPAPSAAMMSNGAPPGQHAALQEPPPHPASASLPISSTATNLSGYSTPLQRPPQAHSDSGAASMMLGGSVERMPATSTAPQLYLADPRSGGISGDGSLPMQRPLLSSPQPRHVPGASALSSSDVLPGVRSGHIDPYRSASVSSATVPWPNAPGGTLKGEAPASVSATPTQRIMVAPADRCSCSSRRTSCSAGGDADSARVRQYAARLAALQQTVRVRRHDLKAQRREMEALRDEWRTDMQDCKQRGDRAQARHLRKVKVELEVLARELNGEVLRLKEVHESIHEEAHQFHRWLILCQQSEGRLACEGGGAASSSAAWRCPAFTGDNDAYPCQGEGHKTPASPSEKTADVAGLLQSMVDRTGRLEELLLMSRLTTHSSSPHRSDTQHSDR
ncbi:hypothetical protein LSCM4_06962 [Leishmania orientalis]|uniref:WW domain-containing protein n=1 Tax=Leishmania orientalis TaxID=2249476 RepID=A0A836KXS9_9TRYP|nr:hypothetical protein LSCM4_06962 [Leishmania orientalis]